MYTSTNSGLLAAIGGGLFALVMPCTYPMIPITSAVIAGTAREDQPKSRTVGLTLTYAVGLALLYAAGPLGNRDIDCLVP